mgnify:CR=1 FL=1
MDSFPFQQDHTWRKLGFLKFYNSTNYREVLEQNPQWNVMALPPLGAQMRVDSGTQARTGLSQASFIYTTGDEATDDGFYPFDDRNSYIKAAVRYPLSAIVNRVAVNGYTFDSEAALTGNQVLG